MAPADLTSASVKTDSELVHAGVAAGENISGIITSGRVQLFSCRRAMHAIYTTAVRYAGIYFKILGLKYAERVP